MAATSRHDLPWWSDPDFDETGDLILRPVVDEDAAYERYQDMLDLADASDRLAGMTESPGVQ